ncbi:MAG: GNAT family N-acetyltransferase [Gammaproteobacteria bacterium]|nr:GNAT family N-acetyltransferase [Gammaproteobacteria bacterium]
MWQLFDADDLVFSTEKLITEHYPAIHPVLLEPFLWVFKHLLHEDQFSHFSNRYPHLTGIEFIEQVIDDLGIKVRVETRTLQHIPSQGAVLLVANHPTGTLDGLALMSLIASRRPDVKFIANHWLTHITPLADMLLPVSLERQNTKQDIRAISEHLQAGCALVVFPAGEVSRLGLRGIKDGPWRHSFLSLAQRFDAPIVPLRIKARNSAFFYGTSMIYKPMATLLLISEMFKRRHKDMNIFIGAPIAAKVATRGADTLQACARLLKRHVYRLGTRKQGLLQTFNTVASPENPKVLTQAINACSKLGKTASGKEIVRYVHQSNSPIFREIGRLREVTFRAAGEGTGQSRDYDPFDLHYEQLLLWNPDEQEIVGAYRVSPSGTSESPRYCETLFEFGGDLKAIRSKGVELGRSFIQPKYQGSRALNELWVGLGAYLRQLPDVEYLYGAVTLSPSLAQASQQALVFYYQHYFGVTTQTTAKCPYPLSSQTEQALSRYFSLQDLDADFVRLKRYLTEQGDRVPTLFKQYTQLAEPDGVRFFGFSIDPNFSDCIDALVCIDLAKIRPSKQHYFQLTSALEASV